MDQESETIGLESVNDHKSVGGSGNEMDQESDNCQ